MNTNSARTIRATMPAVMLAPSFADERGGAPDLQHLDARAGLYDVVIVIGAGGPDLAPQLHTADALGVRDALDDQGVLAHERRGAGADAALAALVLARDR